METINSLMQTIAINHYPDDLPLVKMAEHKLDPIKKASKFLLAVEVYNGFLTQHFKGYGSQKTGRSETETALWRHSWKALAEYSFMPHWRVSTGMDYRWDLIRFPRISRTHPRFGCLARLFQKKQIRLDRRIEIQEQSK